MLICARADCDDFTRAPGRLNGALPGTAVPCRHSHGKARLNSIVEADCQQVVVPMVAAAKRQIENIHSVGDARVNCVEDVFAASIENIAREYVVITQPGTGGDTGHIVDVHAVHDSIQGRVINSGRNTSGMRSMILDRLCIEILLVVFVVENFCNDDLWRDVLAVLVRMMRSAICCIALGKSRRITEAGWIKEGMQVVDTGIDVANLDASSGHYSASSRRPGTLRVNDLVALAQVRMVKRVVLNALHHRRGCNCLKRGAAQFYGHGVKRNIVLAGYLGCRRICSQPSFELIASSSQLGAI